MDVVLGINLEVTHGLNGVYHAVIAISIQQWSSGVRAKCYNMHAVLVDGDKVFRILEEKPLHFRLPQLKALVSE